jgi:hypothetical protein
MKALCALFYFWRVFYAGRSLLNRRIALISLRSIWLSPLGFVPMLFLLAERVVFFLASLMFHFFGRLTAMLFHCHWICSSLLQS